MANNVPNKKITCLAGGVGAARFLQGLARVFPEENITVGVNTGDDITLYGLHISPDIDIVTYTLSGIVDEAKGWGIRNDTFNCLAALRHYGYEVWFNIGDQDLATHLYRTEQLGKGLSLCEVTAKLVQAHALRETILPMTNDKFETRILTEKGEMHFQEYMVKRMMQDDVVGVRFVDGSQAKPCEELLRAIYEASGIIICPSNPIVSIGTILSLRGIRTALRETRAKIVAVSPIIAGKAVKGPAEKLMHGLGLDASALSVASLYKDFLDTFILDTVDKEQRVQVETLGIKAVVTNTLMKTIEDKQRLAEVALACLQKPTRP
jgi:LPPG:FO 2-phospho-L-lactate transferase